jgi:hypothetical protein
MAFSDVMGGLYGTAGALGAEYLDPEVARQRKRERDQQEAALRELEGLQVPDIEKQRLSLEGYGSVGDLDRSEFGGIQTDPRLREAQMRALQGLQDQASAGGLTLMDRARLAEAQDAVSRQERGSREALQQSMAARGMAGSGQAYAAQLANQQGAATRSSRAGLDVAAEAQRRALESLQGAGRLGGQIRGQEWGEQAARAGAQDAINRFNWQNRQRIADNNVDTRNTQQAHNAGLYQQQFQNQAQRAGMVYGGRRNAAADARAAADRRVRMWAGTGQAVGGFTGGSTDAVLPIVSGGF